MSDFQTLPLEDCLSSLIDYRGKSPPKAEIGIPVISAKVVKDGRISRNIKQRIDTSFYPIWMTRGLPEIGDVVLTTEGPLGEVAQLDAETVGFALGQRIVALRGKKGILDNTFLKFLLSSPRQQEILASYATGTTVEGISQKALRRIPISIPNYSDQLAIGFILKSLDDKIDLNCRMNETLEAMAQTLFYDWFIGFGPVRAKMEGRQPHGLAAEIAALFPAALDVEGKPEGWEYHSLYQVIELNPSEKLGKSEVAPYLDMAALPVQGSWPDRPVLRAFGSGMKFRNRDTLLARITPCLENGKTAFIQCLEFGQVAWGSTEFIVMRSKAKVPAEYCYILARDKAFRDHAIQSMTGTSGRQRVQAEALARYSVVVPSDDVWRVFGEFVQPWFETIRVNAEQSETLTELRDLLLPKLLSGELRLRDTEQLLGDIL